MRYLSTLFISLSFLFSAFAQDKPVFVPIQNDLKIASSLKWSEKYYFAIKCLDVETTLANQSKVVYLGDGLYLLEGDESAFNAFQKNTHYQLGLLDPESKISYILRKDNERNLFQMKALSKIEVYVSFFGSIDEQQLLNSLTGEGIQIKNFLPEQQRFETSLTEAQIGKVAALPFIRYIAPKLNKPIPLLGSAIGQQTVNIVQSTLPSGFGLSGKGIKTGEWDESTVGPHLDFEQRLCNVDKADLDLVNNQHATGVAGMIAGGGLFSEYVKGMAPKASIYLYDFYGDLLSEYRTGIQQYSLNNTNHSYYLDIFPSPYECDPPSGWYVTESSEFDKLALDFPNVVHVLAVGNSFTGCGPGGSVVPGLQGCKNVIDVGVVDINDNHITSSVGPTFDGRIKPELVARGDNVFGLTRNNGFGKFFASSFAAPQVTGIVSLMQEQYKKTTGTFPRADIVKALLCNTAFDLGTAGPDYKFGFGRVNAYKAITALKNNEFTVDQVTQGQTKSTNLVIPANAKSVRVTLTWMDKEAQLPASKILVNDLDLELVDPSNNITLPWTLGAEYISTAVRGRDSLNNIEQITLTNPTAGTYQVRVKGYSVPFGPQSYALAFHVDQANIQITNPIANEAIANNALGSSYYIRFEAVGTGNLTIDYSENNGGSWTNIASNISPTQSYYPWFVASNLTDQALIRITDGITTTIQPFRVVKLPSGLVATPCDRTLVLSWTAEAGATYKILQYKDTAFQVIATTSNNFYRVANLENGVNYMFSIISVIGGKESPRSDAVLSSPRSGNCNTTDDVGIYECTPLGGRKNTSSELSTTQTITIKVKNFGSTTVSNIPLTCKVNGTTLTGTLTGTLAPDSIKSFTFSGTVNLSAIGNYPCIAYTGVGTDGNIYNDTLKTIIEHILPAPATLPYYQSFETVYPNGASSGQFSLLNMSEYDWSCDNKGSRLRAGVSDFFANTGKIALTIDNYTSSTASQNDLILHLNLANYVDSLIYLDFSSMNHRESEGNDVIYVRGKDTDGWISVYDLYANRGKEGKYIQHKGINLSKYIILGVGSNLSNSAQIRFSLNTLKPAVISYGSGGYSLDDIKVYSAGKDIGIYEKTYDKIICGSAAANYNVKVLLKNNDVTSNGNITVHYQVNNNPEVSETFTGSLDPQQETDFIFTTKANVENPGIYTIKVWIDYSGDHASFNDTITYQFNVLRNVTTFPFVENFETGDGNLVVSGNRTRWEWGTPNKDFIQWSGQGDNAWTTNLEDNYENTDTTWVYLGCFNFSSFIKPPLININTAQNIETGEVGQGLYDFALAEFSADGTTWKRIGTNNGGYNWYNNIQDSAVWDFNDLDWQVASSKINLTGITDKSKIAVRLKFQSDGFVNYDGMSFDDLHVLEYKDSIAGKDSTYFTTNAATPGWVDIKKGSKLIASVFTDGQSLGEINAGLLAKSNNTIEVLKSRNILCRRVSLSTNNNTTGNYKVRIYFTNDEYFGLKSADDSIKRIGDLCVLQYFGPSRDLSYDNNSYSDYAFYNTDQVEIVPYLDGYYIECPVTTLGEFYITGKSIHPDNIPETNITTFTATRNGANQSQLSWTSLKEVSMDKYVVYYAADNINFTAFDSTLATNATSVPTQYGAIDSVSDRANKIMYYQLWYRNNDGSLTYVGYDTVSYILTTVIQPGITGVHLNNWILTSQLNHSFKAMLDIYTIDGKLLFSKPLTIEPGTQNLQNQVRKLENGTYIVQIRDIEMHSFLADKAVWIK